MRRSRGAVAGEQVDVPRVAGLVRSRPVGPTGGPPWRAREVASGADVLVRPLPPEATPAALSGVPEHPHLLAVQAVDDERGRPLLVSRWPTHGRLDALLERRGGLTPGEVTGLGFAVARALATLHAEGRVHGQVGPPAVVLGPRARPLLDGAALAVPTVRTAAHDVAALGDLLVRAAAEPLPMSVRAALSAARDPDPALRPSAADLARELVAEVHPEPLRLVADAVPGLRPAPARGARGWLHRVVRLGRPVGAGRPSRHAPARARRAGRSLAPLVVGAVALAGAVLVGRAWAALAEAPVAAGPGAAVVAATPALPTPAATDWRRLVEQLDAGRAVAFTAADVRALTGVDAPGSPAWSSDVAAVRALAATRLHADRYDATVRTVHVVSATARRTVLDIGDVLAAYRLVDGAGCVVAVEHGHGLRTWRLDLVASPTGSGWLVEQVRAM